MTGARARDALLQGPLGQAGTGLLTIAVLVAFAAMVAFTMTVQRVVPSPPPLTTTALIEGAAA